MGGGGGVAGGVAGGDADGIDVNLLRRMNYSDKASHARAISSLKKEKEDLEDRLERTEQTVRRSDRRAMQLEADFKLAKTRLEERTTRFTESISRMQENSREQARKHKLELEKKDRKREKDLAQAKKRKVAAVKDATRKVERRLAQSQTASRRHRETMEVRLPFPPLCAFPFCLSSSLTLLSPLQAAHVSQMKEKELAWERVRAASYRNERELRKTITTLNADLSSLVSRTNLLTLEKEFELAEAAKEARRDERHVCSSRLKEQRSVVRRLETALAAEADAKQVSHPPFRSRTPFVRSGVAAPMRSSAPVEPRPCLVSATRSRIRVATLILLSSESRNNVRRRIHARSVIPLFGVVHLLFGLG